MSDRTAKRHVSDERLSLHLDGEAEEVGPHLEVCETCAKRFALLRAARELTASLAFEPDEPEDSDLVENALLASPVAMPPDSASLVAAARSRGGHRTPFVARAAAVLLVLALVGGGVALAAHHGSNHATASATAAVNGQQAATAAAQQRALAAQKRAAESAVLEFRPVIRTRAGRCTRTSEVRSGAILEVTTATNAAERVECLLLGEGVVGISTPARITLEPTAIGSDAFWLPVTFGASHALEQAGVPYVEGKPRSALVPPVSDWNVVLAQGSSLVGEVNLVLEQKDSVTPSYSVLIVGVSRQLADALGQEVAG